VYCVVVSVRDLFMVCVPEVVWQIFIGMICVLCGVLSTSFRYGLCIFWWCNNMSYLWCVYCVVVWQRVISMVCVLCGGVEAFNCYDVYNLEFCGRVSKLYCVYCVELWPRIIYIHFVYFVVVCQHLKCILCVMCNGVSACYKYGFCTAWWCVSLSYV